MGKATITEAATEIVSQMNYIDRITFAIYRDQWADGFAHWRAFDIDGEWAHLDIEAVCDEVERMAG